MKTLNHYISTLLQTICSSLLALLGFGSCSDNEVMYGMPPASFEIKGSVTDEQRQAVADAEIRIADPELPSDSYGAYSTTTDKYGNYSISLYYYPEVKVVCVPKEAYLKSDSVTISMNRNLGAVNFILGTRKTGSE